MASRICLTRAASSIRFKPTRGDTVGEKGTLAKVPSIEERTLVASDARVSNERLPTEDTLRSVVLLVGQTFTSWSNVYRPSVHDYGVSGEFLFGSSFLFHAM